ncbi:uncharacterized protein LOC9643997 [Selaginella moellendorffii]|uniref:uncharacterized protein LOC9643997 n=1 Tax=Selaginella moellendorffii TaxID=88036 RepID=UPI000D1C60D4|nr:uncharacterized protein LOC9643997 [Selaginella moellendorffii]|eukprot:XP_002983757.2 uncharacterized protein LOC9643997 [Selaginella moellendorffii]
MASSAAAANAGVLSRVRTIRSWKRHGERFLHRKPSRKVCVVQIESKKREPRQFWMSRDRLAPDPARKCWFPYKDEFNLDEQTRISSEMVIGTLDPMFAADRKQKFDQIIANRTFSICPVVEGLFDIGNICAVFRTAEAFGLQSVHVIANSDQKRYKEARNISMGAEKWLDVEVWENTNECVQVLRSRGYRIAVTDMGADTVPIHELDWTIPTAVIFGNEHNGTSEEALALADVKCHIPMVGMVESFNVSVAAGILMYHIVGDRLERTGIHGDLSSEEQQILRAEFYLRNKRNVKDVVNHLLKKELVLT